MNIITFPNSPYRLHQPFEPAGDQPTVIAQLGRPAIVMVPNKTLAAQLYSELTRCLSNIPVHV